MKNKRCLSYLLVAVILSITIGLTTAEANQFDSFMQDLRNAPNVITAFREGLTIWVQVPGSSEYQVRGQEFADMICTWYTRDVGGSVCVRVFYGKRHTVGRSCN